MSILVLNLNSLIATEPQNVHELWRNWREDSLVFLRHDLPKILLVIVVAIILIKLLQIVTHRLARFSTSTEIRGLRAQQLRTLSGIITSVGIFIILFIAAMQVLPILGINMGPLLASAGIAGLAIGFGAQTLVHDVINGFFILLENQYDIGDVVRVAGVKGSVETMTLRRTVLRDDDGSLHHVPNSQITIVTNLTRDWAQIALHVTAAYDEDSEHIVQLLQQVGKDLRNDPQFADDIVADPQVPGIERVSSGEVDYLMLVKTRPGRQYAVTRELRRRIKECFQKNNIKAGAQSRVYVLDQAPGKQ
jgi:moderate conductance mechanosensitive channel